MKFKFLNYFFLICCLVFSTSCGKTTEQKITDAIDSATIHLSKKECQSAIGLLEAVGRQNTNKRYLKALSSAYACRAGYSTTVFFGTDIALTASPAPLGGMTKYSTSLVTTTSPLTDDAKFRDLQTAIDILAYAGGISKDVEPRATERAKYFNDSDAGDINSQLTFMMMVQLGKLLKVYSDADSSGVKGGGSGTNVCFTDYQTTPALVRAYLANGSSPTGACHVDNSPHIQLGVGVSDRRKRLCEGVVLMNSILDILPSVLISAGGGDLDSLGTVAQDITDQKTDLSNAYPTIGSTLTVMSQYNCENDSSIDLDTLASYYAVIFEALVN